jgi:hypothetical protein
MPALGKTTEAMLAGTPATRVLEENLNNGAVKRWRIVHVCQTFRYEQRLLVATRESLGSLS